MTAAKGTVLVTDSGRGSALAVMRSLGGQGWRVVAADCDPRSLGSRSRYCHRSLQYPDPERRPEEFIQAILEVVREESIQLVIPVTDAALLPLAEAGSKFPASCRLAVAERDALAMTTDKLKTLQLAERLNVPVPRWRVVETRRQAVQAAKTMQWPVVLKPRRSRVYQNGQRIEAFQVDYADSPEELEHKMAPMEGRQDVLLQEYVQGVGCGVDLLMDDGRPLAAFQHRRIRDVPVTGGVSACCESVPLNPKLYDWAVRLLGDLRWTGLAMVEFKVGQGGTRLMEINGRIWGSLPLAIQSGMDFPARLAQLLLEGRSSEGRPPATDYRIGVRSRSLELEMIWIASVLRGKRRRSSPPMPGRCQAAGALLQMFKPGARFYVQSFADPWPGLAEIPKIGRRFRRKLREEAPKTAAPPGRLNHPARHRLPCPGHAE